MATAFCPNPDNLPFVNHCNERKDDNKAFNLDWCSAKENMNYGTRNQRAVKSIRKRVRCIETGIVYESVSEAAKAMGITTGALSSCLTGRNKTSCGYHWEYIEVNE